MPKNSAKFAAPKLSTLQQISTPSFEKDLRYLAFDNSAQANIITTISTGKIELANAAACKLLGYSHKQLLAKNRDAIFDIKETGFKEMLKQRAAEGKSIALLSLIKKNGQHIPCEITSAIFLDEKADEKAIITITDLSQQILKQKNIDTEKEQIVADDIMLAKSEQKDIDIKKEKIVSDNIVLALEKSDAQLHENNQWIKYIARASYDIMWDWDIATGQIYVGESIKEVFGYKIKHNMITFSHFCRCLLTTERKEVEKKLQDTLASGEKKWKAYYMMKRQDGSIASTISRASIVRNEEGKAIRLIGATQDVSRIHELENKLEQQITIHEEDSEKFLLAAKVSSDVIWDWNLLTNEVFIGEGFEELFGYHIKNNISNISSFTDHIHPDDKDMIVTGLQQAISSSVVNWEHVFRFIRSDNSVTNVFKKASIIRDANGKAYRIIGAMHDLSQQNELEEKLAQEIKLKEKKIEEAMQEAKETERSDIGKELHDNVNQLLSASKLYLDMAKKGGGQSEMFLNRSTEYTLSAIEAIRKLTRGLTSDAIKDLGLCVAIESVAKDMMQVNNLQITCKLDHNIEDKVNDKFKHNIFRIIQEQISNILKHAVATKITIQLSQNKQFIMLNITDNGVGFDTTKKRKGIGLDNIKSRAEVFNGKADFVSSAGEGCVLKISFPMAAVQVNG